ncbi:hypothetical protein [Helicobacter sp. MIT 01-3238]|uniref:hypothetical protein n=1 Tax=Helicobacter sp. MIT 01-3238 TaxID=398627 RepID=UPI0015F15A18|nr:hypothetical protein [Helicobacter sp. MIT 01-3238]
MTSKNIATKHIISRQNRQEMIGKALIVLSALRKSKNLPLQILAQILARIATQK